MHEIGLAQNVIDIVEQEMDRHGVEKLAAIHLAVGAMSCVVPEQMTSCFEILTENSRLAGTKLKMKMVPITYRCTVCHKEFTSEGITVNCPFCRSGHPELIAGRELRIEYLEVID